MRDGARPRAGAIEGATVELPSGDNYSMRRGVAADAARVTALIHDAFTVWKERGLRLGPMSQTEAETAAHLAAWGYVAEDRRGALAGTFSLAEGRVARVGKSKVRFTEDGEAIDCARVGSARTPLPSGRLLVFKRAAVARAAASAGLGAKLYALAEGHGRRNGFAGMALQTVREAEWLYDWYARLGFRPVGSYRYPGRDVDTVLMIKPFEAPRPSSGPSSG